MINVSFAIELNSPDRSFENFKQLADHLKSIAFAPSYRMRTNKNEFGRVVSRDILAVYNDGTEKYLGGVHLSGDTHQTNPHP